MFHFAAAAAQNSCATRDFTSELGPIRTQGSLGWCFAEAAADLVTQQIHLRVSAAALGSEYFNADPRELAKLENT